MSKPRMGRVTERFDVSYSGYNSSRLIVRLDDDRLPAEVMFLIGPCLQDVKKRVAEAARNCQLISVALRYGTPLKDLVDASVRRLPTEIAVTRLYGPTPAPVANDLTEWVLRHLALTYLSPRDCTEVGVHPGFWCPACDQAQAICVGHSFFCPDCDWKYTN